MAVIIGTILLLILGIILLIVRSKIEDNETRTFLAIASPGVFTVSILLFLLNSYHITPPGYTGVVITLGSVSKEPLSGFNWVNPISEIKDINIQERKLVEKQEAETIDTQSVKVTVLINIRPDPSNIPNLYETVGENYDTIVVDAATKEAVKAEVANHKVIDLISNRAIFKSNISKMLENRLAPYKLHIINTTISDIDFSDEYDRAIERKQLEEQTANQRLYELTQKETEAKMALAEAAGRANSAVEKARGEAESVRLAAQADADALNIRGQAQAEYNRLLANSLTPSLIRFEYLKHWDGKLPNQLIGESSLSLLLAVDKDIK